MNQVNGVTLGDVVFILFICGLIYGIMILVNRGRKRKTKTPENDQES